jgi:hypothetical protein
MKTDDVISRLNAAPKVVKARDGRRYVNISTIEKQLDLFFTPFGWETIDFRWTTCVNEIIGSLTLRVKNPDTGEWVSRTGAGAVMIQMKKDSNVLDVSSKITNAMEKMMPKLKSDCTRNAAKSLGNVMGRNVGRKDDDVEPFTQMERETLVRFQQDTKGLVSIEAIQERFRLLAPSFQESFDFKKVVTERVEFAQKAHLQQLKEATAV